MSKIIAGYCCSDREWILKTKTPTSKPGSFVLSLECRCSTRSKNSAPSWGYTSIQPLYYMLQTSSYIIASYPTLESPTTDVNCSDQTPFHHLVEPTKLPILLKAGNHGPYHASTLTCRFFWNTVSRMRSSYKIFCMLVPCLSLPEPQTTVSLHCQLEPYSY